MTTTSQRKTADERRESLITAATFEFAAGGLYGTSTDDIARRAGISQPYLFRLFRTKKELFLAAVERCFDETTEVFRRAAESAPPGEALHAMGAAYFDLVRDRTRLMMQLQTYAACDDPDVRRLVRRRYGELVRFVEDVSQARSDQVGSWFGTGMLLNVIAAMDVADQRDGWVARLLDT
jgi:AcrR family transcriptional regulator